ncbi:hypothetical protein [Thermoactinospora rubra]|uniref:hypothetical protein n=1 Tax=Thermoactinospora rubra TaxID=1088767 RepID=UPI000A1099FB|nr:hypothetical protein [Thermoactinospora rubra]
MTGDASREQRDRLRAGRQVGARLDAANLTPHEAFFVLGWLVYDAPDAIDRALDALAEDRATRKARTPAEREAQLHTPACEAELHTEPANGR